VDVFGRQLHPLKEIVQGPPGEGFCPATEDNFDIENKELLQVAHPQEFQDAINLNYLQEVSQTETYAMRKKVNEPAGGLDEHVGKPEIGTE